MNDLLENFSEATRSEKGLSFRANQRFGGVSCRVTSTDAIEALSCLPSSQVSQITSLSFSGVDNERVTGFLSSFCSDLCELSVSGAGLTARGSSWSHGCNVIQISMDHSEDFFTQIRRYRSLRVLRLANNRLSNRGLSLLGGLENLTGLDLSGNEISKLSGISSMSALKRLNLSNNNLSAENLWPLGSLESLATLNLSGNPLTSGGVSRFYENLENPISGLSKLSVASCGLESASFLRFFPSIEKLVISRNPGITGLGRSITSLGNLSSLEAVGISLTKDSARSLANQSKLMKLDLRRTVGALEVVRNIEGLSGLQVLRVDGVGQSEARLIGKLVELRRLTLNNGGMGNEGVSMLSQIGGLTQLSLSNQQLDDGVVTHLIRLGRLRSLTLSHNALKGESIEELRGLGELIKLSLISNPLEKRSWEGLSDRLNVLI